MVKAKAKTPGRPLKIKASQDRKAEQWVTKKLREFMEAKREEYAKGGNNAKEVQSVMDVLSGVMMMNGPPPKGMKSALRRVTGFTKAMLTRGDALGKEGRSNPAELKKGAVCKLKRSPHSSGKRKKRDMLWVYHWFHNECPLVSPDKSRKEEMKGRLSTIKIDGRKISVTCRRSVVDGDKNDMVQSFLASSDYKQWLVENPGDELAKSSVQKCICPCMSKAKVNECSCKICSEFQSALGAWHKQREVWHKQEKCTCPGCSDKTAFAPYRKASQDVSKFRAAVCCPKQDYPHLKLPHQPDIMPQFYPLKCCKESACQPAHIDMCKECGVDNKLYRHPECIEQRDGAGRGSKATWKQWMPTEVDASEAKGGTAIRDVFREREGTRKELVDRVFELAPRFLFHMWLHQMTRHMGNLRVATFDGLTTIIIKADFAATVELLAEMMATCEFGRSTNLYVALVLHSPVTKDEKGEPLEVKPGVSVRAYVCACVRVHTHTHTRTLSTHTHTYTHTHIHTHRSSGKCSVTSGGISPTQRHRRWCISVFCRTSPSITSKKSQLSRKLASRRTVRHANSKAERIFTVWQVAISNGPSTMT